MSLSITKSYSFFDLLLVLLLCFAAAVRLDDSFLTVSLFGVVPIVFVLTFAKYGNPFMRNPYMVGLLLLYGWIGLSWFGALYLESANAQMQQLLGSLIFCGVIANLSKNERLLPWLYVIYIVLYIGTIQYANENLLSVVDLGEERLQDEKLNANTFAYYTFYFTVALYVLGDLIHRRWLRGTVRVLFFLTIVLSFYIALFTASRQVLIVQVPLYLILLYIRYALGRKHMWLLFVIVGLVAYFTLNNYIESEYEGSLLQQRNENELAEDERTLLLREAIAVGNHHLVFGVGPGNFIHYSSVGAFSHCTYTELYANAGVMALLLFIWLIVRFVWMQWKRYRRYRDKHYLGFMVFGLFFILDNIFYVFYANLWLMGFFILMASHSETYYRMTTKYQLCA